MGAQQQAVRKPRARLTEPRPFAKPNQKQPLVRRVCLRCEAPFDARGRFLRLCSVCRASV